MKFIYLTLFLFIGSAFAQTRGTCPRTKPGIGVCVFNPELNCSGDESCSSGQLCCPNGCNRSCMDPIKEDDNCPPSAASFGACVFDPKVNCLSDSECSSGQVCCPSGCNKVCKKKYNRPNAPFTPGPPISGRGESSGSGGSSSSGQSDKCPAATLTFGACVFNKDINCLSDDECKNGQVCCSDGCNKICKDPKDDKSDPSKIPIISPRSGTCPATPNTFGACVFNPDTNCLDDNACPSGQLCCPDGCNKRCMVSAEDKSDPSKIPITTPESQCPARASGGNMFGACVFDAKVNCVDDKECTNGQVCCPAGCNKSCVNPRPKPVHSSTKP